MAQVHGVHLIQLETPDEHSKIPMDGARETIAESILIFDIGKRTHTDENIATASLLEALGGPEELIDFADDLGFETKDILKNSVWHLVKQKLTPLEMGAFVSMVAKMEGLKCMANPSHTPSTKWGESHLRHGIGRACLRRV